MGKDKIAEKAVELDKSQQSGSTLHLESWKDAREKL